MAKHWLAHASKSPLPSKGLLERRPVPVSGRLPVAARGSSGVRGSRRSCLSVLADSSLRCVGGSGFGALGNRCGRVITALRRATARDGRRELRAARAFQHLLRQLAELFQCRPKFGVFGGEVVAGAARVAVLLYQAEQAAQRMGAFVEPALQGAAVNERGVM